MSTGHLPKSVDDMYAIERDGLWAIPTAEVPLTSMNRGEILDEAQLPVRLTAQTACFRREAGAAGRDTRGCCACTSSTRSSSSLTARPTRPTRRTRDILARAEGLLQVARAHLPGTRPVHGRPRHLVGAHGRPRGLQSRVSTGGSRCPRSAGSATSRRGGPTCATARRTGTTAFVHTVNGSALAWARIWAALVETYRQADGSVQLPEVLAPYMGDQLRSSLTAS